MTLALTIGATCTGFMAVAGYRHTLAHARVSERLPAAVNVGLTALFGWATVRLAVAAWSAS